MKKRQGRKVQKTVARLSKKITGGAKKATRSVNQKTRKAKAEARRLVSGAKKKLNKLTKKSSNTLRHAKDKVYATEKEIVEYVKANPVKSASAVALVGLIAGFVSRYKKGK